MKPQTSIEDLPPEMIWELFKHLSLEDLCACSLVNKRWHSLFADFKVDTLVVYEQDVLDDWFETEISRWTYPNRRFQVHELCETGLFFNLAGHPQRSKHLKHLALPLQFDEEWMDLGMLKSFSQLQHLEIVMGDSERTLSHSSLEVLVCCDTNYNRLSIDCPKLRVLVYDERENLLDVKHPETIRELQTNMAGRKLDRFKHVESLVTSRTGAISKATLKSLPALKKLHINTDIESAFLDFRSREAVALDRMKRTLREFLGHVQQLKRADFQFRFAGFELTNVDVDQIDFDVQVEEGRETVCDYSVYLKNFHLIEPDALHFIHEVNYSRLTSKVAGDLPSGFLEKFTGVDEVYVRSAIQDDRQFRCFLKSLRSCRSLWLDYSQLGRDFYDYYLQRLAPSLETLHMSAYDPTGLLFDFDFLYELPRLKEFSLSGALSLETIESVVPLFECLEDVQVKFDFECKYRDVYCKKKRRTHLDYRFKWSVHVEDREPKNYWKEMLGFLEDNLDFWNTSQD